jgi:hypothetical protein
VFEVRVTTAETSPRLTVIGPHGVVTYDHRVEEVDHDISEFHAWLSLKARQMSPEL